MEDMLCGGGSRVCDKCGKTTFGSEIHYCEEKIVLRKRENYKMNEQETKQLLPKMIPDENTPKGTIVRCSWNKNFDSMSYEFFICMTEDKRILTSTCPIDSIHSEIGMTAEITIGLYPYIEIDIEADLQFRAFLNAPKEYRWFAINEDGIGKVFIHYPECIPAGRLSAERSGLWITKRENMSCDSIRPFSICVGRFDQYKHLWKEILIERKD